MAYIGNIPATSFEAVKKDRFTGLTGTSVTLSHSVSTVQDIVLWINAVKQDYTSYSVNGTALTVGGSLVSSDIVEVAYLGRTFQTVNPSAGSVGTSQLVDGSITSAKLASGVGGVAGISSSADATAITINSSEQVGIGTTSPAFKLEVNKGSAGDIARFTDGVNANTVIKTSGSITTFGPDTSNSLAFQTNNTEQMRLDTSGTLNLLKTNFNAAASSSNRGLEIRANGSGALTLDLNVTDTGTATIMEFNNGNGNAGTIQTSGSSTAYNTSSDYRLKENVNYDFDATTRLKQLKPARFNFIADADTTVDGFIAHEVSSVVPEAISGEKDAVNEDGSINAQGIDQSKLVPLLVKTIQELEARITELENA